MGLDLDTPAQLELPQEHHVAKRLRKVQVALVERGTVVRFGTEWGVLEGNIFDRWNAPAIRLRNDEIVEVEVAKGERMRTPDLLWEAWVAEWGEPLTRTERSRLNSALKELRQIGATPKQITGALKAYDREFIGCARSPQGVTGNWRTLTGSNCDNGNAKAERSYQQTQLLLQELGL